MNPLKCKTCNEITRVCEACGYVFACACHHECLDEDEKGIVAEPNKKAIEEAKKEECDEEENNEGEEV